MPGAGAGFRDEGAGTGTAESHRREGMPCRADHGGGEDADRHAVTCHSMGVPPEPLVMHRGYLNETTQATTRPVAVAHQGQHGRAAGRSQSSDDPGCTRSGSRPPGPRSRMQQPQGAGEEGGGRELDRGDDDDE